MADEEQRTTHYATARIELEDVTEAEATWFFQALHEHEIEIDGFEAVVVSVGGEGTTR